MSEGAVATFLQRLLAVGEHVTYDVSDRQRIGKNRAVEKRVMEAEAGGLSQIFIRGQSSQFFRGREIGGVEEASNRLGVGTDISPRHQGHLIGRRRGHPLQSARAVQFEPDLGDPS